MNANLEIKNRPNKENYLNDVRDDFNLNCSEKAFFQSNLIFIKNNLFNELHQRQIQ